MSSRDDRDRDRDDYEDRDRDRDRGRNRDRDRYDRDRERDYYDEFDRPRRGSYSDEDLTAAEWLVAILCSGIGCIIGIVWMISGNPKGTKMFGISILFAVLWTGVRFAIVGGMKN